MDSYRDILTHNNIKPIQKQELFVSIIMDSINPSTNWAQYSWNLHDEYTHTTDSIVSLKPTQKVESDPFDLHKLKWKLTVYPNGFQSKHKGNVSIFLSLLHMPHTWKTITIAFRLQFKPNNASRTFIATFTPGKQSWGWPLDAPALTFKELKQLINTNHDDMILTVSVVIIRIIQKTNDTILFQNKFKYNSKQITNASWTLAHDDIEQLQLDKTNRYARYRESNICDNMWSLMSRYHKRWNQVSVYLVLCNLPPNISELEVLFTLRCPQNNKKITLSHRFSAKSTSWGVPNFLECGDLDQCDTITLKAEIQILNEIDLYGNNTSQWKYQNKEVDVMVEGLGAEGNTITGAPSACLNNSEDDLRDQVDMLTIHITQLKKQMKEQTPKQRCEIM
eukprot:267645_1